jgi:hypothetical protein
MAKIGAVTNNGMEKHLLTLQTSVAAEELLERLRPWDHGPFELISVTEYQQRTLNAALRSTSIR